MATRRNLSVYLKNDENLILKSLTRKPKQITEPELRIKKLAVNTPKKITVFLVDDDLFFLTALEHYLMEEVNSIKIKTFSTGETALKQMNTNPEIVVLDYQLNSDDPAAKNGVEILKRIKYLTPNTRVLMLSSRDGLDVVSNSIEFGAFDYMIKSTTVFVRIKNMILNIIDSIRAMDKMN